ncbi:MAG: hypothetical protein U0P81_00160 [Holophagaceae bacterium]
MMTMPVWMSSRAALVLLTSTSALVAQDPRDAKFLALVEGLQRQHAGVIQETEELGAQGRAQESVQRLLSLIPPEKRTAAECYWLGSLLFDLDPAQSSALHRRAYELAPKIPAVAFEWALEQHRAGHHAEAVPLYLKSLDPHEADGRQALLADCYIRLEQPEKAIDAWKRADHANHHSGIDGAIHWVYGKPSPFMRRSILLAAARKGDREAWTRLIQLDCAWDTTWWQAEPNLKALEADLREAKQTLPSAEALELETLSEVLRNRNPDVSWLKELQSRGPWILEGKPLPRNTVLAARLLEWDFRRKLEPAQGLVDRFKDELWRRARSGATEAADALHILAGLTLQVGLPIDEMDRFGWQHLRDPKFALSLLSGKGKQLKSDDPDLLKALNEFPGKADIALLAARAAYKEKKPLKGPLMALIKAEFTSLETDDARYSYALKGYFSALAEALKQKDAR